MQYVFNPERVCAKVFMVEVDDATRIILERLNAEGYAVVSVSELLGEPVPGKLYYSN